MQTRRRSKLEIGSRHLFDPYDKRIGGTSLDERRLGRQRKKTKVHSGHLGFRIRFWGIVFVVTPLGNRYLNSVLNQFSRIESVKTTLGIIFSFERKTKVHSPSNRFGMSTADTTSTTKKMPDTAETKFSPKVENLQRVSTSIVWRMTSARWSLRRWCSKLIEKERKISVNPGEESARENGVSRISHQWRKDPCEWNY